MATRIKWLKTALKNFDEEISYIANDDPAAARLVRRRIAEAVALLATHPPSVVPAVSRARANCSYPTPAI